VKSHGSADAFGFERAIERAMEEVRNEVAAPPHAAVRHVERGIRRRWKRDLVAHRRYRSYLPRRSSPNADLARQMDTSDEWIRTRTGIRQRHIAEPSQTSSDLAVEASRAALAAARIRRRKSI